MPTESELRDWLRGSGSDQAPRDRVDAATVIRRSKRRRLPSLLGAGGVLTLAIAGISVASVAGIRAFAPQTMVGSAGSAGGEPVPGAGRVADQGSAEQLNLCGGKTTSVARAESGLVLTTHFPASAPADGRPVTGTVTLTNTGTETVSGTTAASAVTTVSQRGITLWHSNGAMIMLAVMVDLAPGQSMDYPATFRPVRCDHDDDLTGFRDNLPALGAGEYQLSAAIDLLRESSDGRRATELVTGPTRTITLE